MTALTANNADAINALRTNLRAELTEFEARLPSDVQDISEEHERYARVVMLMVRSLDMLLKFERTTQKENATTKDKEKEVKATRDIFAEIECRLARLTSARQATKISEDAE